MSLKLSVRLSLVSGLMVSFAASAASTVFPVATTEQLVEAIQRANETPEADVISLERTLYVLDAVEAPDQAAALPAITTAIVIRGNGAELRRYADDHSRVFYVAATGHLRLERIILAEGSQGAIRNFGKTDLRRVQLVDNTANGAVAIIENHGDMTIEACEVSFNTIAGAQRDAGTIVNWGELKLTASTFEGNQLTRRYPGVALASTLLNYGHATIADVVIAENVVADEQWIGAPQAPQAPLVNLGNGRLDLKRVRERDSLPGVALVAGTPTN